MTFREPARVNDDDRYFTDTFQAMLAKVYTASAIMHFAASMSVPESVANPLKYYHNNNTAKSVGVVLAAVDASVPHIVFSSTTAVCGVPDRVPIAETAPTRPINPYGASKLMIERILADTAAAHPLGFAALRYFNVAGADPAGRTGQSTPGATHLIKVIAEHLTGKRPVVEVFGSDFDTPTERACATISMSPTLPTFTSARSTTWSRGATISLRTAAMATCFR